MDMLLASNHPGLPETASTLHVQSRLYPKSQPGQAFELEEYGHGSHCMLGWPLLIPSLTAQHVAEAFIQDHHICRWLANVGFFDSKLCMRQLQSMII